MIMRVLVDLFACTGFALSTAFLALFRPRQIFRPPAVNAIGFVLIVWLLFVSGLFLSVANGGFLHQYAANAEDIVYLAARIAADALLAYRLYTFLKYRHHYNSSED